VVICGLRLKGTKRLVEGDRSDVPVMWGGEAGMVVAQKKLFLVEVGERGETVPGMERKKISVV